MAITNRQARFIAEYLVDFNATQAAIRAGYSEATAYSQGSRLLKNVEVSNAIRERVMSADEVLLGLTDIARGDIADLMDITPSGFTFRLVEEKEDGKRIVNPKTNLIKKIKQKVTTILAKSDDGQDQEVIETEIELYSRHEALRDMGKFHKLFTNNVDITTGGEKIENGVSDERFDRSISTLADALRESISGQGSGPQGAMGSTE